MEDVDRLLEEIQQIKEQYKAEVSGVRKQWPKAIKDRVMKIIDSGIGLRKISERTGIPYHTIDYWTAKNRKSKFHHLPVVVKPSQDVTTVTVAKSSKSKAPTKIVTVTVKTPDGFIIRIDSVRDAILILKQIRRTR